ncbi:NAD(P)H-dependent FMN reductase [Catalinimonas alkaloidigena]|uniref:NAD(P)H-dependent FMN reductase n=1 Tax=Catalinimonas alkaloidigena TaxID=1075417 RepID=A0A1G8XFD7_9BACT|nr:NAD(P)H-dependent oxidoreductase [Catalinimonas alkaloidigena]SDJ89213.1 NAD(P)H-dependent FMN reductase [Catalinimonas alkaloidigena]
MSLHVAILSTSIRPGRNSHRVGLYFKHYLEEQTHLSCDLIDLQAYNFPIFEERLRHMEHPPEPVLHFAERVRRAAGILVITPEYNGGYPASLKNVIDLLSDEWKGKPTGLVTVSTGPYGGALLLPSLLFSLWKKGVWVVTSRYHVSKVHEAFGPDGTPADAATADQRTQALVAQLVWSMEAREKMRE